MNIHEKILTTENGVRRFVSSINAGGTIASLSIIGANVGASTTQPSLPFELFVVLVIFIVGLIFSIFAIFAERTAAITAIELALGRSEEGRKLTSDSERNEAREICEKNSGYVLIFNLIASGTFIVGTLLGLIQIYCMFVIKT